MVRLLKRIGLFSAAVALVLCAVTTSVWAPADPIDSARLITRPYEFDYASWTMQAFLQKISIASANFPASLKISQQRKVIDAYFRYLAEDNRLDNEISKLISAPGGGQEENKKKLASVQAAHQRNRWHLSRYRKLAESVIQFQVSQTVDQMGFAKIMQPFPPILFQTTDLPKQLILSPRNVIRQEKSISLIPDIPISTMVEMEENVENLIDYSALVVPVGGVGTYPTMVLNTARLPYLLETVSHEWIHNYLVFRPLGIRYSASPALRTMNETTASIAGKEISQAVLERYYPDLVQEKPFETETFRASFQPALENEIQPFDFRKEMYAIRIRVEELLEEKNIEAAEKFMDEKRLMFWENGYQIRKINQAYFAFHGAYADTPYSAAGDDPVGDDVRNLRVRYVNLVDFVDKISTMSNYGQLKTFLSTF